MPDVRKFFDKEFLYAFDLEGRTVAVTIESVQGGTLVGTNGTKSKKPVLKFVGKEKKFALNITNCRVIAGLFGSFDSKDWLGKSIYLYPTTTTFGPNTVECIRVKNQLVKGKGETFREDVEPPSDNAVEVSLTADDINFGGAQ